MQTKYAHIWLADCPPAPNSFIADWRYRGRLALPAPRLKDGAHHAGDAILPTGQIRPTKPDPGPTILKGVRWKTLGGAGIPCNAVQLVTLAESDIQSINDLAGKRVSGAAHRGSGTSSTPRRTGIQRHSAYARLLLPSGSISMKPRMPSAMARST